MQWLPILSVAYFPLEPDPFLRNVSVRILAPSVSVLPFRAQLFLAFLSYLLRSDDTASSLLSFISSRTFFSSLRSVVTASFISSFSLSTLTVDNLQLAMSLGGASSSSTYVVPVISSHPRNDGNNQRYHRRCVFLLGHLSVFPH